MTGTPVGLITTACPLCLSHEVYTEEHQESFPRRTREGRILAGSIRIECECQDCGHRWHTYRSDVFI